MTGSWAVTKYFFVSLIILFFFSVSYSFEWEITTLDSIGPTSPGTCLALDSEGNPHVIYATADGLRYARKDGDEWIINSVGTEGWYPKIAIDEDGIPHILFTIAALYYGYKEAGNWTWEYVDTADIGFPDRDIVVDSSSRPHIAYSLRGPGPTVKYGIRESGEWNLQPLEYAPQTGYVSLVLTSTGEPRIAYDVGWPEDNIKLARLISGQWQIDYVDTTGELGGASLAIDSNGCLHLAYFRVLRELLYGFYDVGWHFEIIDSVNRPSFEASIALTAKDSPYVCYNDGRSDNLRIGYRKQGNWFSELVDTTGRMAFSKSLKIDELREAHISYVNLDSNYLKYAFSEVYTGVVDPIELYMGNSYELKGNYPNPFNSSTRIVFTTADELRSRPVLIEILDLSGRTVRSFQVTPRDWTCQTVWNGINNDGKAVCSGIYFYRVRTPGRVLIDKMTLIR